MEFSNFFTANLALYGINKVDELLGAYILVIDGNNSLHHLIPAVYLHPHLFVKNSAYAYPSLMISPAVNTYDLYAFFLSLYEERAAAVAWLGRDGVLHDVVVVGEVVAVYFKFAPILIVVAFEANQFRIADEGNFFIIFMIPFGIEPKITVI